jgi:LPS-assembly protein
VKPRQITLRRALRFAGRVAACALAGAALGVANAAAPPQVQGPVLLQADEVTYDSRTGIVTAAGNVEISDQARVLRADMVRFNQATNMVDADGHVTLIEPDGNVAMAEHVELTGDLREGALQGFYALIGEHGRLGAVSGTRREGRFTQAIGAVFTPCEICAEKGDTTPLWQVKAARVTHDQVQKELTFESARFEFLGVPVLYLPVFTQPDPTVKHKSGILYPVVGTSTYLGTFVQVPYHIVLSPSRDITLQPFITTSAGDVMLAEYRQRWEHGGMWLQGSLGYDDAASRNGDSRWMSHLFGSGRGPLTDVWRLGFDAQLTSNDTYLRRYDISYLDRLTSDVFVDGVMGRSRGAITSYYFQGLRAGDRQGLTPLVLPLAEYTYIPEHKIYGGRLQIDSSALVLTRDEGTDVVRGSASADWKRQFITGGGQIYTAEAMVRSDVYHVNREPLVPFADGDEQTIGRGLGYLALEWRWPFARRIDFQDAILVVEPIAQLVAATGGGNPPGIPNEDSTTFEFDETNLFSPNEFPGLDLWTGGPRSNIGVRATAFFPGGGSVEGFLGQEFRTRRDPNFAPGAGVGDERSDIVGRIKIQFPGHIDLVHRFRIDPVNSTLRRNEVYLTANYRRSKVDLAYLKLEPETTDPSLQPREQVAINTTLAVYGNWAVFGGLRQDLARRNTLESEAGVRYEDECFMAQLGFSNRQTSDRDLRPTSALILKVGLKTGLTAPMTP